MLRRMLTTLLVLACATLAAAGCAESTTATDREEAPMTPSGPTSGARGPLEQQAVGDLAGRLGVPEDEITVVSVEEVTWRDGSLGCAEPGMMYTQALVDGSRIILEAAGERHEYHAGGNRDPFLCAKPTQ